MALQLCLAAVFLALPAVLIVRAQQDAGIPSTHLANLIQIDGPREGQLNTEVSLRVLLPEVLNSLVSSGEARIQWVVDEKVLQEGDWLRCRSAQPGAWQIVVRVVRGEGHRRETLASGHHTLVFARERPKPASAQVPPLLPVPSPAPAAPAPPRPPPRDAAAWVLTGTEQKTEKSLFGGSNTIELSDSSLVGISVRPLIGRIASKVTWTEPPATLVPGRAVDIALAEEMELIADFDVSRNYLPNPLRATTSGKFSATYSYHHDRSVDTLSESAKGTNDVYRKSKIVRWRVPEGKPGDQMTVEVGGEGPAGSGSRFYAYVFQGLASTAKPPASVPAPPPSEIAALTPVVAIAPAPPPATPEPPIVAPAAPSVAPAPVARPLVARLQAERAECLPGEAVLLVAAAKGGVEPYCFSWGGQEDPAGPGTNAAAFVARKPGDSSVQVVVTDAGVSAATGRTVIAVKTPLIEITQQSPPGSRLYVEERAAFAAGLRKSIRYEGKPYRFRWHAEPPAEFDPPESTEGESLVRFAEPGRVRVWAEALSGLEDATAEVVAQSDSLSLEVLAPEIRIVIDTPQPYIGLEAGARCVVTPEVKGIEVVWSELPANATESGREANGRELRFCLLDDQPVKIAAVARLRASGRVLAEPAVTVAARGRGIALTGPTPKGPAPRLWRTGVGLETVTDALAVGQALTFRADLSPAPTTPVTWQWSCDSAACSIRTPDAAEAEITCSETGSFTITARAQDVRGVTLGSGSASFAIAISATDIADSRRQAEARELRDAASALLQQSRLPEAIAKYKESLASWPSAELETHIAMLDRDLDARESSRTRAAALREEGVALERDGRLADAIARYRASLEAQPDAELQQRIAKLETERARIAAAQAGAKQLRDEAAALEQQGEVEAAARKYRESLAVLPDAALESHAYALESALRQQQEHKTLAFTLGNEARTLELADQIPAAIAKYKECLQLWSNAPLQNYVQKLEAGLAREAAARARAVRLRDEGLALEAQGRPADALDKLRESFKTWPDAEVGRRASAVESALAKQEAQKGQAGQLVAEARELEQKGQYAAAAAKCRESLRVWPDPAVQEELSRLQGLDAQAGLMAKADRLRKEADALQAAGRLDEALLKYMDCINTWSNRDVAAQIPPLERRIADQKSRQALAARRQSEGRAFEEKQQLDAAVAKYKASLEAWPDETLQDHVKSLEQILAKNLADQAEAKKLADEGSRLEQQERPREAVVRYRQSLALRPGKDTEQRVQKLEAEIARQEERQARARALREEAFALVQADKLTEAVAKYRESIAVVPDKEVQNQIAILDRELARQDDHKARAAKLRSEGAALEKAGRLEAAVARYEASHLAWPDPTLVDLIAALNAQSAEQQKRDADAARLREEATALELDGKLDAALTRLKECLAIQPDAKIQDRVAALEKKLAAKRTAPPPVPAEDPAKRKARIAEERAAKARRADAARLREEAAALEKKGQTEAAIPMYKESLKLQSDPALQDYVSRLEQRLLDEQSIAAQAVQLQTEGYALEQRGQIQDAVRKYERSLALRADPELERHVQDLDARAAEQRAKSQSESEARQQQAQLAEKERIRQETSKTHAAELKDEGRKLEAAGNIGDAVARYHASLLVWPDPALSNHVAELNQRVAVRQAKDLKAAQLRADGAALEFEGQLREASARFKESLRLVPDAKLEDRISKLDRRIADEQATASQAAQLRAEGDALEKLGQLQEALGKYEQSLALLSDPALAERAQQLNAQWKEQREQSVRAEAAKREAELQQAQRAAAERARQEAGKARAAKLTAEGRSLETAGQISEAISRYQSSLLTWPDPALSNHVAELSQRITARQARDVKAARLRDEGAALESEGRLGEAVARFKESLSLVPDAKLEERLAKLAQKQAEQRTVEAQLSQLRADGAALERQGRMPEAVRKYERSLMIRQDAELERHVSGLQSQIAAREAQRARAMELRTEGDSHRDEGRPSEAIAKYKESLALWADDGVRGQLAAAELELRKQQELRGQAAQYRRDALRQEKSGDLDGAITAYRQVLRLDPEPGLAEHLAALQLQVDRREQNRRAADRLWREGLVLLGQQRRPEALARLRESTRRLPQADRQGYVRQLEGLPEPKPQTAPLEPPPPPTAVHTSGTTWKGTILVRSPTGTMQWPLRVVFHKDGHASGTYRLQDPATGRFSDFSVDGGQDPNTGEFRLAFRQTQDSTTIRGSLTGKMLSASAAGGAVQLTVAPRGMKAGSGIWRISRAD